MKKARKRSGKPTLVDVAAAANVSAITVSRALRNPDAVSAVLRERIEQSIDKIGYVPNTAAQALASAGTNVIGIIIPSMTNSVFADVIRGVYDAIEDTQFQVQFGNTNYSPLKEEELLKLFLGQRPAGLLVTGAHKSLDALKLLRANGCPVVQIMETTDDPIDMLVGFSHEDAAAEGTRHLIGKGYRKIGFLAAQMDTRTQQRVVGYERAMREAGLYDPKLVVTTTKPSRVSFGTPLCAELFSRVPDVDAVQTNNDDIALGALFELQRRRVTIPDEVGICGFNDLNFCQVSHPALTSIRTYRYEMGKKAVEMLISTISGKRPAEPVVDTGFLLVERESTQRTR